MEIHRVWSPACAPPPLGCVALLARWLSSYALAATHSPKAFNVSKPGLLQCLLCDFKVNSHSQSCPTVVPLATASSLVHTSVQSHKENPYA